MAHQVAQETAERYRLVTRSDFDGLVCAALLKQLGMLDDILFVHPKDVQDGIVELSERDITTNLPYDARAGLVFDHHSSENCAESALSTASIISSEMSGKRGEPP